MNPDNLPVCLLPVVRFGLGGGSSGPGIFAGTPALRLLSGPKRQSPGPPPAEPGESGEEEADARITGERNYGPVTPNFALKPADVESGFFLALFSDDRVK